LGLGIFHKIDRQRGLVPSHSLFRKPLFNGTVSEDWRSTRDASIHFMDHPIIGLPSN